MAKASMNLPSGASVTIEGTPEEVARILELNGGAASRANQTSEEPHASKPTKAHIIRPSIAEIANVVKSCEKAERIETAILDKSSQLDRTLLPLYIIHEHFGDVTGLSTGEISAVTTDLGSRVSVSNVSHTTRGAASRYVMVD